MDAKQQAKLKDLIDQMRSYPSGALELPLPRRLSFEHPQEFWQGLAGNMNATLDVLLEEGMPAANISKVLLEESSYGDLLRELNISRTALESMVLARRFMISKAPIFTLRTSLCQRLDDMEIGKHIPMMFIKPPYPTCYFEFGPAEDRRTSPYRVWAKGKLYTLEGAFITYHEDADGSLLSKEAKDAFELDFEKPLRCMEVSFTASPCAAQPDGEDSVVMFDEGFYWSTYWTNDEQGVESTLERTIEFLKDRNTEIEPAADNLRENMELLTKALLYLMTGNREKVPDNQQQELESRLASIQNPVKRRKAEQKLKRTYNRVLVGPNKPYVPLEQALDDTEHRTGVRPHFRRAHWSTRWSGKGKTVLKPVQIGLTLVNREALSDKDADSLVRDYDVF